MYKRIVTVVVVSLVAVAIIVPQTQGAIKRVAKRYNMLNFYGGYADPWGEYDEVGTILFIDEMDRPLELEADELFDGTYYAGVDYGTLYNRHLLYLIGFRFTDHNVQQWLHDETDEFNFRQYDIELNANYLFLDLTTGFWSPYAGAGVAAGFTSFSPKGYDDESELKVTFSLNFGADLKIFQSSDERSFLTLASMNNYNLLASDDRPKYFNVGVGLRYFFR